MGMIFDALAAIGLGVGGILLVLAGRLLSSELDAWTPRIVDWLITRAVKRLPAELQHRMAEEWRTFINDTPGKIGKLLRAIGLSRGAADIFRECSPLREPSFAERVATQSFAILNLCLLFPLFIVISAALLIERRGPVFVKVKSKADPTKMYYRFYLGSGITSEVLRRSNMVLLPMIFNFAIGDVAISWDNWKRAFLDLLTGEDK